MTTKLVGLPAKKTQIPFEEAVLQILQSSNEESRQLPIRNMVIISESEDSYTYHVLNDVAVTSLLGTIELVRSFIVLNIIGNSSTEDLFEEDDED